MDLLNNFFIKATRTHARIIIPESSDPRVLIAAEKIKLSKLATLILFGNKKDLEKMSYDNGCNISGIEIIDPGDTDKITFAIKMLADKKVDGIVCGVEADKRVIIEKIKSSIHTKFISGFAIILSKNMDIGEDGIIFLADCEVNLSPNDVELADIALQTADSFMELTNREPRIAFLSYSTKSSGNDEISKKIKNSISIIKSKNPALIIDGELQADTALLARASKKKDLEGVLEGYANILICPDLASANISYKLIQILGDNICIGPILQGIPGGIGFVSRSCVSADIVNCAAAVSSICDKEQEIPQEPNV